MDNKNKDNQEQKFDKSRRNFIRNVGLAGLTTGATTIVSKGNDQTAESANAQVSPKEKIAPDESRSINGGSPIYDAPIKTSDGKVENILPPLKERVLALKELLIQKKLISEEAIQGFVNYYENVIGPHLGAAVVAHAWVNPDWKAKLINPPADKPFQAALLIRDFLFNTVNPDTGKPYLDDQLTYGLTIGPEGEYIRIVENGVQQQNGNSVFVHNLVTCTVCSCYPQALLGTQPMWYKSHQYRARSVSDPFSILLEFAQDTNENKDDRMKQFKEYATKVEELRVWDSNSEVRFFVIPEMPKAWAGLSENELRKRITRNSMLGTEILYSS